MSGRLAFTTLALLTGGASHAQKFTAAPKPSAGKALIYIYRQGGMLGALGQPVIFINDYLLAQFRTSNYTSVEVPQGSAAITATFAFQGHLGLPEPIGAWAQLPGCVGLDWRRLAAAPPADISLCQGGLAELFARCSPKVTYSGCALPGCVLIKTTHVPACFSSLNGSADAPFLLGMAPQLQNALASGLPQKPSGNLHLQLRIEAEAGNTYYVKWSVSTSGGKMNLVDAAIGEKEIRGLHLAK
jgi:hypothetical protein